MIIHKVNQHNNFMIKKKLLKNWLMENLYMNNMGWKKNQQSLKYGPKPFTMWLNYYYKCI
jgi:hypothetical protein